MVNLKRVNNQVYFHSNSLTELTLVKKALSFTHPGAIYSSAFQSHHWDGKVKFFNTFNKSFNYGMLHYVLKRLSKKGVQYKLNGFEDGDTSWIKFSKMFLSDERDYQRNAIVEFFKKGCGIIKVPTRGGKTFISAEIIRLSKEKLGKINILFVTDAGDAFKQNIDDISTVLEIDKDSIGRIRESNFIVKDITVAMIQTIQSGVKRGKKDVIKYLKTVDLLIIDEVQEYSSKARINVIKRCKNVKNILAISGTPYKKDDIIANLNIENLTGGIIYEIEEKKLVKKGVLSENKILLLNYNHEQYLHSYSYQELNEKLIINNQVRNITIVNVIDVCEKLKLKILVLFLSKKHGFLIERMSGVKFICGDHSDEERRIEKQKFLTGKGRSLLVSSIWKKAITLPDVEIMLNASGGKEESMVIQIRGRALGATKDKKKSLHIDFIDNYDDYFNEHSLGRIKAYEEKTGSGNIDVLEVSDKEFLSDLEHYLMDWFNG